MINFHIIRVIVAREFVERICHRLFAISTVFSFLFIVVAASLPIVGDNLVRMFAPPVQITLEAPAELMMSMRREAASQHVVFVSRATKPTSDGLLSVISLSAGSYAARFRPNNARAARQTSYLRLITSRAINHIEASRALVSFDLERWRGDAGIIAQISPVVVTLLLLMYTAIAFYGMFVALGVTEEKENRVIEVLLCSVRPIDLMIGKVFGVGAVAVFQMMLFLTAAGVTSLVEVTFFKDAVGRSMGMFAPSLSSTLQLTNAMIPAYLITYISLFYLLAFFSYAAIYAGVGAVVRDSSLVQIVSMFVNLPLYAAFYVASLVIADPDSQAAVVGSLLPLVSPVIMVTRLAVGSVPEYQVFLAILVSLATILIGVGLSARLYRVSLLLSGSALSLRSVVNAITDR